MATASVDCSARVWELATRAAQVVHHHDGPKLEREVAQTWVEVAHQLCPYSNAARGNVGVALTVV